MSFVGHVVLEIDERLRAAVLDVPQRRDRGRPRPRRSAARSSAMRKPHSIAAIVPAAMPSGEAIGELEACRRPRRRRACRRGTAPGTNAASASFHTGLPPRWQVRCTAGFQPPDTASASHAIVVVRPLASITSIACDAEPAMHMRDLRAGQRLDAERAGTAPAARCANRPPRRSRCPAARASSAVRQPSSLLVKTASRRPGAAA